MINVKNLTRCFGSIRAVDDVSFDVKKGEVLGFLGPNGAGKTTTMRLITGYLDPEKGGIEIDGIDMLVNPREAKSRIGYLPENAPLYRDMHVCGFLNFIAGIRGLKGKKAAEAIEKTVAICHLEKVFYQNIDTLSKGYVRRTSFAQAILHDPPILVLDEPTDGLDPNQKFEVRNLIEDMGRNKAIIISTHILEEVDACCSRVVIISNGKIVANGTPDELRKKSFSADTIVITVENIDADQLRKSLESIKDVKTVAEMKSHPSSASFRIFPSEGIKASFLAIEIANFAKSNGLAPTEFHTDRGRLDDVFRKITAEPKE